MDRIVKTGKEAEYRNGTGLAIAWSLVIDGMLVKDYTDLVNRRDWIGPTPTVSGLLDNFRRNGLIKRGT